MGGARAPPYRSPGAGPSLPSSVGCFDRCEPIGGQAVLVLAAGHLAAGVTQTGDRGAHGMRQPAETLPDLSNRRALGTFEHADQHPPLSAHRRSASTGCPLRTTT